VSASVISGAVAAFGSLACFDSVGFFTWQQRHGDGDVDKMTTVHVRF